MSLSVPVMNTVTDLNSNYEFFLLFVGQSLVNHWLVVTSILIDT